MLSPDQQLELHRSEAINSYLMFLGLWLCQENSSKGKERLLLLEIILRDAPRAVHHARLVDKETADKIEKILKDAEARHHDLTVITLRKTFRLFPTRTDAPSGD